MKNWEEEVKQVIIGNYYTLYFGKVPAEQFSLTLHRIFQRKQKVIKNLGAYVAAQVAKGRPAQKILNSIGFYAKILAEYTHKNTNQPRLR